MSQNDRRKTANSLRKQGYTFKQIGETLGVTGSRAREIVNKEERLSKRPVSWMDGLSVRTRNGLSCEEKYKEKENVIRALKSGEISDNPKNGARKIPNFGKKSLAELINHLELAD